MRRWLAAAILGLVSLVATPAPAHADTYAATVRMLDNVFAPEIVRIDAGASVEWSNDGHTVHTVTADDGSWDSGDVAPDAEVVRTFSEPGVYTYYCRYHGTPNAGMTGTVVVGDVPLPGGAGDGVTPGREQPPHGYAETLRVPADFPTIQAAVDHVHPGGMVLIAAGVYKEQVTVTTPYITIRGLDRNRTIVDGEFRRANGIEVIEADGVVVQNMTARHELLNGFYWSRVHGFWGSYLTAYDNGDYGLFAYASDDGQFDHSFASGSPDSGFYIGQCDPCRSVITDVIATNNAAGFSGTNASGDLAIVNSEWYGNLAGIVPNTLDSELLAPQHDAVIAGNYVHDNGNPDAPTLALTYPAFGTGILVTGGRGDLVADNLVEDSPTFGISVMPIYDSNVWLTKDNVVRDNIVRRSGLADLGLGAPSAGGDCFSNNAFGTSHPPAIQTLYPCGGSAPFPGGGGSMAPTYASLARYLAVLGGAVPGGDWRTQPAPPPQPQMEGDPKAAPPVIAIGGENVPQPFTIRSAAAIQATGGPTVGKEIQFLGVPLATSWASVLIGLYGSVLPFTLYATWVAVATWDLIRQGSESMPHRARWMLVVLIVPFIGPLLYFAFGRSPIPRELRLVLTFGGIVACLVFFALGALLS
jgi:plastocyanin